MLILKYLYIITFKVVSAAVSELYQPGLFLILLIFILSFCLIQDCSQSISLGWQKANSGFIYPIDVYYYSYTTSGWVWKSFLGNDPARIIKFENAASRAQVWRSYWLRFTLGDTIKGLPQRHLWPLKDKNEENIFATVNRTLNQMWVTQFLEAAMFMRQASPRGA